MNEGDYTEAARLCEESLRLFRELGDTRSMAIVLSNLGKAVLRQGEHERAVALYEESLQLYRATADKRGIDYVFLRMGEAAHLEGNDTKAIELYHESVSLYHELGDRKRVAMCLEGLTRVAVPKDNWSVRPACMEQPWGYAKPSAPHCHWLIKRYMNSTYRPSVQDSVRRRSRYCGTRDRA